MDTQIANSSMPGSSPSLGYRLEQLRRVASDLRVERALARSLPRTDPSPIRLALGGALLQLGAALVARPAGIGAAR